MIVLVTGGRQYTGYEHRMWLYEGLKLLDGLQRITSIIEGGANGFDLHAQNWAHWQQSCGNPVKLITVRAEWEHYSAQLAAGQKNPAGAIRNVEMAKLKPDVVLACPGGAGTANMVRTAIAHGLKVVFLEKMPVTLYQPTALRRMDPCQSAAMSG